MIITNKKGTILKDLSSWEIGFNEVDNEKHWKKGRSAYSLADYMLNHNGKSLIDSLLQQISDGKYNISSVKKACIEHESKFDKYRGTGRMNDLALFGENDKYFIGIEAKVDETFGDTILEAYNEGAKEKKSNPNSKKAQRVLDLVKKYYNQDTITDKIGQYRYQLLHYLAGAMAENDKLVLMPVLVFHTKEYSMEKGSNNQQDFFDFMQSLNFKKSHTKEGYPMFSNTIENTVIYSFYIDIHLNS